MANPSQVAEQAVAVVACANDLKSAKAITDMALAHNSALAIDWNDLSPEAVTALAEVTGASAAEISNAIGSLAAFQTLWGTHGGNFEKLAKAIA